MRFLLDEDVNPEVATVARGHGADIVSVHELGRRALSDEEQLRFAAADGRVLITRDRNDFLFWTQEFFRRGEPHAGVLIVSVSLPNNRAALIAHALGRWIDRRQGRPLESYAIDFLSG